MNPFEIRAKLIEQAQEYLAKQQDINLEFAKKAFDELVKQGQKSYADYQAFMPKPYTFEDVLDYAQKLYGFVSNAK